MTVTLRFTNKSADKVDELTVARDSCESIAQWYGGYHAGDDYTVEIDGEAIDTDMNGLIATDTYYIR